MRKKCVCTSAAARRNLFVTRIFVNRSSKVSSNGASVRQATPEEIQALADKVMAQIAAIYARHDIEPNAVQQQMLASHVRAMAQRSLTGEPLPEVEEELFEDISPETMQLAQQIVDLFGNLPREEAWLLSVHIEVARSN
ncbi:glycine dehydrogenase [Kalamiella piersonii]|nr:glycine dehydrogenase [Pantoea piersonii]NYB06548.1 glycine dehydrogenase [Pantoea piersonii]NYB34306.1 glycine dehydrogenase [Pantoea piersonii]RKJ88560.1 glycine dehydrogenase [Pantoea piersonii]